jgi:hypothetical protein
MIAEPVLLSEALSPSNEAETGANVWTYATLPTVQPSDVLELTSLGFAIELTSLYRTTGGLKASSSSEDASLSRPRQDGSRPHRARRFR